MVPPSLSHPARCVEARWSFWPTRYGRGPVYSLRIRKRYARLPPAASLTVHDGQSTYGHTLPCLSWRAASTNTLPTLPALRRGGTFLACRSAQRDGPTRAPEGGEGEAMADTNAGTDKPNARRAGWMVVARRVAWEGQRF